MNQYSAWLRPPVFAEEPQTRLARNLYSLLTIFGLVEIAFAGVIYLIFEKPAIPLLFIGAVFLGTVFCYLLLQFRKIQIASVLINLLFLLLFFVAGLFSNGLDSIVISAFVILILSSGLLLSPRGVLLWASVALLGWAGLFWIEIAGVFTLPEISLPNPLKIAISGCVLVLVTFFLQQMRREIDLAYQKVAHSQETMAFMNTEYQGGRTTLEHQIDSLSLNLKTYAEINHAIAGTVNMDEYGQRIVNQLAVTLNYHFLAIYMLAPDHKYLVESYLSKRDNIHEILTLEWEKLDAGNTLKLALKTRQPVVNYNLSGRSTALPHLQPASRSEISLPLTWRDEVLGVLNAQSTEPAAFTDKSVETLQGLAFHIVLGLEQARLLQKTHEQADEINRLNQFYLLKDWRAFLAQGTSAFALKDGQLIANPPPDFNLLDIIKEAQRTVVYQDHGASVVAVPIQFQNEILGVIKLEASERTWTNTEIALLETVINQTALTLENARLLTETRNRAEQEKFLSTVSSQMRETLDLETILQTAAREMQKGFGLVELEIRLLPDPSKKRDTSELYPFSPGN